MDLTLVANEKHQVVALIFGSNKETEKRGEWQTAAVPISRVIPALQKNEKTFSNVERERIQAILSIKD